MKNCLKNSNKKEFLGKKRSDLVFVCTKFKKINQWTNEEDEILVNMAKKHCFKNWNSVASFLPGRSAIQCSARYKRIRPGLKKGTWSEEEDSQLLNLISKFGKNWSAISQYIPSRSGKQIRDRYFNVLDPSISREKFSDEEDNKIISLYLKMGSCWSNIAKHFDRRTGDMIKNRFYSKLCKKIHNEDYKDMLKRRKKNDKNISSEMTEGEFDAENIPDYSQVQSLLKKISKKNKKIRRRKFLKIKKKLPKSNKNMKESNNTTNNYIFICNNNFIQNQNQNNQDNINTTNIPVTNDIQENHPNNISNPTNNTDSNQISELIQDDTEKFFNLNFNNINNDFKTNDEDLKLLLHENNYDFQLNLNNSLDNDLKMDNLMKELLKNKSEIKNKPPSVDGLKHQLHILNQLLYFTFMKYQNYLNVKEESNNFFNL
jgi:hypothetical protein